MNNLPNLIQYAMISNDNNQRNLAEENILQLKTQNLSLFILKCTEGTLINPRT